MLGGLLVILLFLVYLCVGPLILEVMQDPGPKGQERNEGRFVKRGSGSFAGVRKMSFNEKEYFGWGI